MATADQAGAVQAFGPLDQPLNRKVRLVSHAARWSMKLRLILTISAAAWVYGGVKGAELDYYRYLPYLHFLKNIRFTRLAGPAIELAEGFFGEATSDG